MWSLKDNKLLNIIKRKRFTENKQLVVTSGEKEGGQDRNRGLRGTNYYVENKLYVQRHIVQHRKYSQYFIITK